MRWRREYRVYFTDGSRMDLIGQPTAQGFVEHDSSAKIGRLYPWHRIEMLVWDEGSSLFSWSLTREGGAK